MYVSDKWGVDMELLMQAIAKHKSLSEGKKVSLADILIEEISEQISEREYAKGREEGFKKGREEAREEVRQKLLQAAKNLLSSGMPLPQIQQCLDLSDQDVQEIGAYTLH